MSSAFNGLRAHMKEMLSQCTEPQQDLFKRMYDHASKHENPIDGITDEKLDWAAAQLERTLTKNQAPKE